MIYRVLVTVLLAPLFAASTSAQEPLSLDRALARGLEQNPELRALRERATASAARGAAIRQQRLPRLGLEMSALRTNNAAAVFANKLNAGEFTSADFDIERLNSPGALSHLGTSLLVEVPVDISGRINLASQAQAAGQEAFTSNIKEAEAALRLQITDAYFGAVLARKAASATKKALEAARAREAVTEARFNEGVALQSDVLRVRARRRMREADAAGQESEAALALSMLARLMAAPDGEAFELTDSATPGKAPDSLAELKARALESRPTLLAAQKQRDAAALNVQLERKSAWPDLSAQARLTDDRIAFSGGSQSFSVGALLRWNIFDAARSKRRSAALAEEQASREDERAARDRVRYEVEAAFSRLQTARERLAAAEGGALEGREALRVVQERRAQGLATLTDELETEAAAVAAELEEINAARAAVLAEAALRRAAFITPGSNVQ